MNQEISEQVFFCFAHIVYFPSSQLVATKHVLSLCFRNSQLISDWQKKISVDIGHQHGGKCLYGHAWRMGDEISDLNQIQCTLNFSEQDYVESIGTLMAKNSETHKTFSDLKSFF